MTANSAFIKSQLEAIRTRVELHSENEYSIDGNMLRVDNHQPYNAKPLGATWRISLKQERSLALHRHLTRQLYLRIFCGMSNDQILAPFPLLKEREVFMSRLSAVNCSANTPDRHWQIMPTKEEEIGIAVKNGISRPMIPGLFTPSDGHTDLVDFHRSSEDRQSHHCYYSVHSNAYLSHNIDCVRIYWNLKADGAPELVKKLSKDLNHYKIPFLLKCLSHPDLYVRLNSAVLCIDKPELTLVKRLIYPLADDLKGWLNEKIPLFCIPLMPGVGLAASPGPGPKESYGEYMMRQVAHWLIGEWNDPLSLSKPSISITSQAKENDNVNPYITN